MLSLAFVPSSQLTAPGAERDGGAMLSLAQAAVVVGLQKCL